MDYKLSRKNKEGKWWVFGSIEKNQWDNNQASFKVSALEELIELAKSESKEWVNLSLFENKEKPSQAQEAHTQAKGNAYVEPLDDSIPDFSQEIPF